MPPVNILDLTVAQVEALEAKLGMPVTRWREAPSAARTYRLILSEVEGKPEDAYLGLTLRELLDSVDVSGSDPDPEG